MITIEFTKNGTAGSKKVHSFALASTLASFRRAGYTITSDGTAPAAAPAVTAEQTGRVGDGLAVHVIVENHARCGASFRRNSLGATTRRVRITGEDVTCENCR
jgi:hypothetical protein